VLYDASGETIRAYGLTQERGGPQGEDIAIPAHFLVEPDGRIAYRFISTRAQDRPKVEDDIEAVKRAAREDIRAPKDDDGRFKRNLIDYRDGYGEAGYR
jgi:peroxiredoxin